MYENNIHIMAVSERHLGETIEDTQGSTLMLVCLSGTSVFFAWTSKRKIYLPDQTSKKIAVTSYYMSYQRDLTQIHLPHDTSNQRPTLNVSIDQSGVDPSWPNNHYSQFKYS